ncbi:MAG: hypothetical protein ACQEXQ_16305 [Bacillota bacterium]
MHPQKLNSPLPLHNPSRLIDDSLFFVLGLCIISAPSLAIAVSPGLQITSMAVCLVIYLFFVGIFLSMFKNFDLSVCLVLPIVLSAFQNIYLGSLIEDATSFQLQIIIILNFIYAVMLIPCLMIFFSKEPHSSFIQMCVVVIAILTVFGSVISFAFGSSPMSMVASLRNVISPMTFALLGYLAAKHVNFNRFSVYVLITTFFVIAFGYYERFVNPEIWFKLKLTELWELKGIPVSKSTLLPNNFYSSEKLDGEHIRRMVSSFADPVNFGTFIFFSFMASWFLKNRMLMLLITATAVLAISKGAVLGIMIFLVVLTYYFASRVTFILAAGASTVAGVGFIIFSLASSTQSIMAHFKGFTSAFANLPKQPLGHGLGKVGILGSLYSADGNTEIAESGLGVVIGQLGIIGLVTYLVFFVFIFKKLITIQDVRVKVFALSIFFGIVVNIMFNEVALSPNSSAAYFIAFGVLIKQYYQPDLKEVRS